MLCALVLAGCLGFQAPPAVLGGQAPSFALKDLRGHTVRLNRYRGKVVLLNFWATWCAPCLAEMSELDRLQKDYQAKGLQVIGITYGKNRAARVIKVIRKLKIGYPVLRGTNNLAAGYGIGPVLPVTIVVDREGVIRDRFIGILEPEEFERIRELFK
jgi:cytochrome c biogenesis protein CcmG/thiol:disulfide interchange protein DsbE